MNRKPLAPWIAGAAVLFLCAWVAPSSPRTRPAGGEVIMIDTTAATHPFPHFWEQMFGSGRATLSLRAAYRRDLKEVKAITDFGYVRFHGILDDDVGLYDEDSNGNAVYNFSYVDQIYDGLLENGVRPFVELSFMPQKLAAREVRHVFWYHPVVAPPKDWNRWNGLIDQFARHLVNRYGIDEVAHWYFEVWNEPNLDFWAGEPKEATYYELYDHTARVLKRVSPRIRVGGPSTAQAAWVDRFIQHAVESHVPVDFVSTHVYGNDSPENIFGTTGAIPQDRMVCSAVRKVHDQVQRSPLPHLPIIFSEYNASYENQQQVTDSIFMGPWLADTIRQCDGLVNIMSYWTFSDVFEEQGIIQKPFYGGFGLVAEGGVPKPAFNAFRLLHLLGDQRIPVDSDSVIATRVKDGSLAIAVWNLSLPKQAGTVKQVTLELSGLSGPAQASVYRLNQDHGNALAAYVKMGGPAFPTEKQYRELRQAAELPAPQAVRIEGNRVSLTLQPKELDLVTIR